MQVGRLNPEVAVALLTKLTFVKLWTLPKFFLAMIKVVLIP